MLKSLNIAQVVLIEQAEIHFGPRLNILSGETGAGKSMLIDAVNFVLGERAGSGFVRAGAEQAAVCALFLVENPEVLTLAQEEGVYVKDGQLLVERFLTAKGKSLCKINGKTVALGVLRALSAALMDVHGQHEHQSLLNPERHGLLLDRFCPEALNLLKAKLKEEIGAYKEVAGQIAAYGGIAGAAAKGQQLAAALALLDQAHLEETDEAQLLAQRAAQLFQAKVAGVVGGADRLICDEGGLTDGLGRAYQLLHQGASLDPKLKPLAQGLESLYAQLTEASREVSAYVAQLDFNPEALNQLEEQLEQIERLKKQFQAKDYAALLEKQQLLREEVAFYTDIEPKMNHLQAEKKRLTGVILGLCEEMSALRQQAANTITHKVGENLAELGMVGAGFQISIQRKTAFSPLGYDKIEFLIAPNPGDSLKPLAKIASGGEMSGVMLALKTVLAHADPIETFIFDEIDTGVSGRTAQKVAQLLARIGRGRQVLCITHLPQIASMADTHLLIEKQTQNGRAITSVAPLGPSGIIEELARLIGGAQITGATRLAAEELKEQAETYKSSLKQREAHT